MGSNTSKGGDLRERLQMICISLRSERRTIVSVEMLRNHAMITTYCFETVFGASCLMSVQRSLQLNMNIGGGVINKQTTTAVHRRIFCFSARLEQSTFG